jgi:hypothetical protein
MNVCITFCIEEFNFVWYMCSLIFISFRLHVKLLIIKTLTYLGRTATYVYVSMSIIRPFVVCNVNTKFNQFMCIPVVICLLGLYSLQ